MDDGLGDLLVRLERLEGRLDALEVRVDGVHGKFEEWLRSVLLLVLGAVVTSLFNLL